MEYKNFIVIERKVKYPRIELKDVPVLIIPFGKQVKPEEIIEKHKNWIEEKIRFIDYIKWKYRKKKIHHRTDDELKKIIFKFIKKYSKKIDVNVGKTTFKDMKSKWASCSKKSNLSFNLKLKYLPNFLIKYVVFHELVHLIFPNHKTNFWHYIKNEFKNPEKYEEMLYGYWFLCGKNNKKD